MREIDLAYLAGVMDSDGSFTIAIDTWRVRKFNRNPSYQEMLVIGQCDPEPGELAKELFGGAIRREEPRGEKRRPMFYWQSSNIIAADACRALLPYLRIKRRQAEMILQLRAIKDRGRKPNTYLGDPVVVNTRWGPRKRRFRHTRPQVIEEMHALAVQVRELNDTRFPLTLSE